MLIFSFETTLANKTFAPWIAELREAGYVFHLIFLWLPSKEFAINRVAERVRMDGHNVPEGTIRRRYHGGLRNFLLFIVTLADSWIFYDNSVAKPTLIAYSNQKQRLIVTDSIIWHNIVKSYGNKRET